jgi:hypothetical protein
MVWCPLRGFLRELALILDSHCHDVTLSSFPSFYSEEPRENSNPGSEYLTVTCRVQVHVLENVSRL